MLTRITEYTPEHFPYAAIFEQLTRELNQNDVGPVAAYARFQQLRRAKGLLPGADYCSTSITTGGHARNNYISKIEIIKKNTLNAHQLAVELVNKGSLYAKSFILPVDLGYIPTWQQADYMVFWLIIISGFDLGVRPTTRKIEQFRTHIVSELAATNVDVERMNHEQTDKKVRAAEYFKFAQVFASFTKQYRPEPSSAHRLINLIDTSESLGCQTERLFAYRRGVPIYNVQATGPVQSTQKAFSNVALYKDIELIFSYGGTVVDASKEYGLSIHEQADQTANLFIKPATI